VEPVLVVVVEPTPARHCQDLEYKT
jgi:hypothetical protein